MYIDRWIDRHIDIYVYISTHAYTHTHIYGTGAGGTPRSPPARRPSCAALASDPPVAPHPHLSRLFSLFVVFVHCSSLFLVSSLLIIHDCSLFFTIPSRPFVADDPISAACFRGLVRSQFASSVFL